MMSPADNPIRTTSEDLLGRAKAALAFADNTLQLDYSEGLVVGVLGPWGSGKTSFTNMARERFTDHDIPIVDFNPWMFSGTEQLLQTFFAELSSQLKLKNLSEIGDRMESYGELFSGMGWVPVVGPWTERTKTIFKTIASLLQKEKQGLSGRKKKAEEALKKLSKPIVVILDDIDRLSTQEIRDIFKLVRLTASFPNIIYLIAFDRERVEKALDEQNIPGRDYLEKILQLGIDLPSVPPTVLSNQLFAAMDEALGQVGPLRPLDENTWLNIYHDIIRPLIKNMRDVRRYVAAIRCSASELKDQIALADMLGMEAIRIFLPDSFALLHQSVEGLTTISSPGDYYDNIHKPQIERLLESAPRHKAVIESMIIELFPAAARHISNIHYSPQGGTLLQNRRIAHSSILLLYLEKTAGEDLNCFYASERAFACLHDKEEFASFMRDLPSGQQEDVIANLEHFENKFTPEHVRSGAVVLLNLLPKIPEKQLGMFEFGPDSTVRRVVYRIIRSIEDQGQCEAVVQEILPQIETLSSQDQLISIVGHHQGAGHKLVSEEFAAAREKEWRDAVRAANVPELLKEQDLWLILLRTQQEAAEGEPQLIIPDDARLTRQILLTSKSEMRRQVAGNYAVQRIPKLAWGSLIKLFGSEETLRERIETFRTEATDEDQEILALADKYLSGWRPDDLD